MWGALGLRIDEIRERGYVYINCLGHWINLSLIFKIQARIKIKISENGGSIWVYLTNSWKLT